MTIVLIVWIVLLVTSGIVGIILGIRLGKDSTASNTEQSGADIKNVNPAKKYKSNIHNPIAASDDSTNKARTGKKVK